MTSSAAIQEALASIQSLRQGALPDHLALRSVLDLARGYCPPQLVKPSRILPAVQPRFDAEAAEALEPLFAAARRLAADWRLGQVGGALISARDETDSLLAQVATDVVGPSAAPAPLHQSLIDWANGRDPLPRDMDLWQESWSNDDAFSTHKKPWLLDFLTSLDALGLIGKTVLDVGAGRRAASDCLRSEQRTIVQIDRAADGNKDQAILLQADLDDAASLDAAFTAMRSHIALSTIDTIICSQVLNYLDYRALLATLRGLQRPGGRLIIFNQPFEGESHLLSRRGVLDNYDLFADLRQSGYGIEYLQAAPMVHVTDFDAGLRAKSLLIVAEASTAGRT